MLDPMVQNAGLQEEEVNGQKLKSNQTQVCVLADLMQDPMIKKAGLRKEEVLALMLYTGLFQAPPRPLRRKVTPRAPLAHKKRLYPNCSVLWNQACLQGSAVVLLHNLQGFGGWPRGDHLVVLARGKRIGYESRKLDVACTSRA